MSVKQQLIAEIDSLNEQQLEALQKLVQKFIKKIQTPQTALKRGKGWSDELINKTCGAWEGELLTRPTPLDYDNRDPLI